MKKSKFLNLFNILLLTQFTFSYAVFGTNFVHDLEETPFGFYQKICRSNQIGGVSKEEELPKSYALPGNITPIKNQDPLGTCVSFAVSACCEYYNQKILSEAEFTVLAQTDNTVGNMCTGGLPHLGKALGIARTYGLIEDNRLSYDRYLRYVAQKNGVTITYDNNWKNELKKMKRSTICEIGDYNKTMLDIAILDGYNSIQFNNGQSQGDFSPYRLGELYPIHHVSTLHECIGQRGNADTEAVKHALFNGYPVACALNVFGTKDIKGNVISSNWDLDSQSNQVRNPDLSSEKSIGLHAIVLTAFNDNYGVFSLKNSWGNNWGKNKGNAYISYDYITRYSTELVAVKNPN
jgi:hypothetical protein